MANKTMLNGATTTTAYKPYPVDPVHFAEAMRAHWENLGNVSSTRLMDQWRSMGSAFSRAILVGSGSLKAKPGEEHQWQVLQPPTGTGKTQGACVYAAIVAKENRRPKETFDRTGILFVTRLIDEADKLAELVNELAGFTCAIARHSENRISTEEMAEYDVLAVTHQAYANALEDSVLDRGENRLDDFLYWDAGPRFLTIIDESLSNLMKSYRATEEDFRITASLFDQSVSGEFPWLVTEVKRLASAFTKTLALFEEFDPEEASRTKLLWQGGRSSLDWFVNRPMLLRLRRRMGSIHYDRVVLVRNDPSVRCAMAERVDRTLETFEALLSGATYRSGSGGKFTVHASRFLLPERLPGPVILDATAEQEPMWELLGHRVSIADKIDGVRNYRNVTLHVARGNAVGKTGMIANGDDRLSRLLENLHDRLRDRRVFLCLHKALEPKALTYDPSFLQYSVDHWGNIDGRNDWQDFDTAVLFGLPYRPATWGLDMLQALRHIETSGEALSINQHRKRKQIRQTMQTRQIAASVIQAINRIRCRRVIDADGNCAPSDVFLTLPSNTVGDQILSRITKEMPGIKVANWDFKLDGEAQQVSKAHYAEPVVAFMKSQAPGQTDLKTICKELSLGKTAKKDMQRDLRGHDHPFTVALNDLGVSYHSTGRGRGARSYLLKR